MINLVKIGNFKVFDKSKVYIIAEIGTNHLDSNIDIIKKMIDEAQISGAHAVKFQTFKASKLISKKSGYAKRLNSLISKHKSWYNLLKSEELSYNNQIKISNYCKEKKIDFLSTPYDKESLNFLCNTIGVPAIKIASGDLTNHPFLKICAKKKKPILLSTGMSNLKDVSEAIKIIKDAGNDKIILMQCTALYPTEEHQTHLNVLKTYKEKFNLTLGYSDHTLSQITPIVATTLGARVYEKHFTLSKSLPGADHSTSFDPEEFKIMVRNISKTSKILGSNIKKILKHELDNASKYRRSLFTSENIKKNQIITSNVLISKRPGTGISPSNISKVLGKKAIAHIKKDTMIKVSMLSKK